MSIRKKLILSNFGMVLIPLVLFFVSAMLLFGLFMRDMAGISDYYGGGDTGRRAFPEIKETFARREELFAGIRFFIRYDPDRLSDAAFLNDLDARFGEMKSGIVVVRGGQAAFVSSYVRDVDVSALQEEAGRDEGRNHWNHNEEWDMESGGKTFVVERRKTTFADGSAGDVYFLSDMSPLVRLYPKAMPIVAGTLLFILALTNGVLTYFVSRSFIRPLYALKEAAEQIKEGKLDHELKTGGRKDEFGQVGAAFEEMRIRLQHSIALQLQYEDNRKELLSNISHDLKTPITAIKGCVEGILDGIADTPEKRNNYLRMIYKKASDMDRQIEELFLFSKLDLKRLPFHFERTGLVAYLSDCVEELRLQHPNADIAFVYAPRSPGEPEPYVSADKEKLHRVIQNVVDNSIKYAGGGERTAIRIELESTDREAIVRMRDNGGGIDAEALPHVFDRFYRADPSRGGGSAGSGLGLAIVKQIVEEHGGRVWAESKTGEGTTIAMALPKDAADETGGRR